MRCLAFLTICTCHSLGITGFLFPHWRTGHNLHKTAHQLIANNDNNSESDRLTAETTRRQILSLASLTIFTQSIPALAIAPDSLSLETGLLEARVTENVLSTPPYGLEGPDIFYPQWFMGNWKVKSVTERVEAPCGVALFGGNSTFQAAKKEIGTFLSYDSRFVQSGEKVIADREYNVKSIAKAAIGENSVVNIPLASPNKFTAILAPKGAPSLIQVDLITLNRRQETLSESRFDCSEVSREIISRLDGTGKPQMGSNSNTILKEIETTCRYEYNPIKDSINCCQRSAAFLLPSQQSPIGMKMWEAAGGRSVDVRFYDVTYTRK